MFDLGGAERGLAAAAFTLILQWLLMPVAHRWNLLDFPAGRKDHAHPTPITGGIAMAVGIVVTGWMTLDSPGAPMLAFTLGSALLIGVGLLDDKYDLPWWLRICAQATAALVMVYVGGVRVEQLGPVFGLDDMSLGFLSVPFTVFATLGVINAINMIDGADGLAGSLVLTALAMLCAASLYSGNGVIADRVLILAGAVAAFLWFNLRFPWRPQAKIFMGNAGSAFLGYAIVWMAFRLTQNPGHPVSPVLALWLLPIPVMDCLVLMARRLKLRQSPFRADHNHIHHLMRAAGYTPMQKLLVLSAFSAVCGLAAGQALRLDIPQPLLLLAFGAMCLGWYWLTSRRNRVVHFLARLRAVVLPVNVAVVRFPAQAVRHVPVSVRDEEAA